MPRIVQDFLERQAASFRMGGPLHAVNDFDFPLPVLSPEGRDILMTPQAMIEAWTAFNARCRNAGCARLSLHLVAQELPRGQRFRLWLRHLFLTDAGEEVAGGDSIFFCRDRGHRLCVEMIEITRRWGLPFAARSPARRQATAAR